MNLDHAYRALSEIFPQDQLLRKESMKRHTSFRIGGPVDLMILPAETEQIRKALTVLKENDVPVMVMGNGSNLLVRDKGIRGAVIKIADRFSHTEVKDESIRAQSGILLSTLSRIALKAGLTGLEFASGIPGTLGGAVTMNAGAYGGEMKDVIQRVSVMEEDGKIARLDEEQLSFGYRTSAIQDSNRIVLETFLALKNGDYEESKALILDLTRRRQEKQPLSYPSAGSTFKRPEGFYAAALIEECGLKGCSVGGAMVSEKHSGFVVNMGDATAQDVLALTEHIKTTVLEKKGVSLQMEVKKIGF